MSTDKCPKCGGDVEWIESVSSLEDGQLATCGACGFETCNITPACGEKSKELPPSFVRVAALHRIRELEMSEQILRGGAEHLKRQVEELEKQCEQHNQPEKQSPLSSGAKTVSIGDAKGKERENASATQTSEDSEEKSESQSKQTGAGFSCFAVLAHRWGDTDNHTCLVCVVDSEDEAKHWADREEQNRGGKYSCSIWRCGKVTASPKFAMDDSPLVSDSVDQITKARVIPEGKTVAQNMIDDAKRDKRLAELEAERASACGYLERLFASWLRQHFPDNHVTKPLDGDLLGLITQIDNASTRWRELEAENERLSGGLDAMEGLKNKYQDELAEAQKTVKELVHALAGVLEQAAAVVQPGEIDDMGMAAYEEAGELLIRAGVADPMPRGCVIDGKRLEGFEPIFGQAREALKK